MNSIQLWSYSSHMVVWNQSTSDPETIGLQLVFLRWIIFAINALKSLDPGSSIGAPTFSQTIPHLQAMRRFLPWKGWLILWGRLGFQIFFSSSHWEHMRLMLDGDWDRYDDMMESRIYMFLSYLLFYPTIQLQIYPSQDFQYHHEGVEGSQPRPVSDGIGMASGIQAQWLGTW